MKKLIRGDCLEKLKEIETESVHSLVTDPPAGISFMGKDWDGDKGGRKEWCSWMEQVMRECLRVMKPGAHGLVWALPRTSHWTATALEDAGFEIRDVVTHLFGQGFPKSLDISKAIDKSAGAERERIPGGQGGANSILNARKPGEAITGEAITGEAITGEAKQWQGWGTALKPASEHWILIRKPCSENTVAANTLKHGTGGINIDGSRVATVDNLNGGTYSKNTKELGPSQVPANGIDREFVQPSGRFPANLVLSCDCESETHAMDCAMRLLDEQSGISKPQGHRIMTVNPNESIGTFKTNTRKTSVPADNGGGASRFFYCAKISRGERGKDNNHPTVKPQKLMRYLIKLITPPGGTVLDPFMGSGSTGLAAKSEGFRFIGIEKDPQYFEISKKRVNNSFPKVKKQVAWERI